MSIKNKKIRLIFLTVDIYNIYTYIGYGRVSDSIAAGGEEKHTKGSAL